MKNRSNIAASILQNGDMLRSVYEDAQNSEGSATEELNKYLDSIDGKMQQLENRAQEFWATVIDTDLIKDGIDLLSTLLGGLNDLIDTVDLLPTLGGIGGLAAGIANKGIIQTTSNGTGSISSQISLFGKSFSDIGNTITTRWKQVTDYIDVTNDATISGIMSAWKNTSPLEFLSDDSIVNILNDYNKALDSGAEATARFFNTGSGNDFVDGWLKQLNGAPATMEDYKKAVSEAEVSQKGLTASMVASKVAAIALNAAISVGISFAISGLIKLIDNLIHASENAREAMNDAFTEYESTQSEIENLNSELETTNDKIDELNAKQNLSFVEKDELKELQETNNELEKQIALLEKQEALQQREAAEKAVKSVDTTFGDKGISEENIDETISNYRQSITKQPETFILDKYDLEDNIVSLRLYNELLKDAYNRGDQDDAEIYNDILEDINGNITENLTLLYEQKDAMKDYYNYLSSLPEEKLGIDDQEVIASYERVLSDIDYLEREMSPGEYINDKISGILEKVDFQGVEDQLIELGKNGSLSVETLSKKFPDLIAYLVAAGLDAQQLYEYIMALSNPDAINYSNAKKQLLEDLGDGEVGGATDQKKSDEAESLGLFEDESLEAYLTLKTKYTDDQTESWDAKDWAYHIKEELNSALNSNEAPISATITSSVQQIATQLEPQFAKLGEAYQSIFTSDGFTLEDVDNSMLEGLRESFAEIEEEIGVTFDSTKLEGFFDALTDGDANAESVQQAFNDLATAYFYSTDTLENLNEATADSIEKQLEELGVANAQEVVENALQQTYQLRIDALDELNQANEVAAEGNENLQISEEDLENATLNDIAALIELAQNSGVATEALAQYALQKQIANGIDLTNGEDINSLLTLAKAAGVGVGALEQLSIAYSAYQNAISSYGQGTAEANVAYQALQAAYSSIQSQINSFEPVEIKLKTKDSGSGSASSAGSDAADAYLEAFEDELEDLQGMRDRGEISEKEYLDRLRELYQRYFKDREEYLDEYEKYEQEYLEGMESLYNDALSGITKLLGNKIDAIEEEKDAAVDALEAEKEAAEEAYQAEIDALEERKNANQDIIDNIQDEIDAINDAADAREREITLMQARYNLQRAMSQRVKLVNDRYAKYYSNII